MKERVGKKRRNEMREMRESGKVVHVRRRTSCAVNRLTCTFILFPRTEGRHPALNQRDLVSETDTPRSHTDYQKYDTGCHHQNGANTGA